MELEQLKSKAFDSWVALHELEGSYCDRSEETFLSEVAGFGAIDQEQTWIDAAAYFAAHWLVETCDEPGYLIEVYLCKLMPRELLRPVVCNISAFKNGLQILISGLAGIAKRRRFDYYTPDPEAFLTILDVVNEQKLRGTPAAIGPV